MTVAERLGVTSGDGVYVGDTDADAPLLTLDVGVGVGVTLGKSPETLKLNTLVPVSTRPVRPTQRGARTGDIKS